MNDMSVLIPQIIQLFIMLVLGYGIYHFKVIDINFNKQVTKFVLYVSMPCMILVSAINQVGKEKEMGSVLFTFALAVGMYVVIAVIAFIICKIWRLPKRDNGVYQFVITFSNLAFMGFPIANAVLGDKGVFYAAIFNMVSTLLVFTYGVALMNMEENEGKMSLPLKNILNPAVLSSVLAFIIYFADIRIPGIVTDTLTSIGSVTSPLAMILIGTTLACMPLREVFTDYKVYILVAIKQLMIPVVLLFILRFFIKEEFIVQIAYIMLLMPSANNAVLFATEYGQDEKLAVKTVFVTTLASFILLPLLLQLL